MKNPTPKAMPISPNDRARRSGGVLSAMLTQSEPAADPVAATELFGSPEMLARSLFNDFVLPFEIASVLLLVAIVGAVVLAKRRS